MLVFMLSGYSFIFKNDHDRLGTKELQRQMHYKDLVNTLFCIIKTLTSFLLLDSDNIAFNAAAELDHFTIPQHVSKHETQIHN